MFLHNLTAAIQLKKWRRAFPSFATFLLLCVIPVHSQSGIKPGPEGLRPDEMVQLSIADLRPSIAYPMPGEKISVEISIRNTSQTAAKNLDVLLLVDGKSISEQSVDVEAGQKLALHIPWTPVAGTHSLTLKLDPARRLPQLDRSANDAFVQIIVSPKPPADADVAITAINLTVTPDRPTVASISLRNRGAAALGGPLELRSIDGLISAVATKPIPAGATATIQIPLPLDTNTDSMTAEFTPRFRSAFKHPEAATFIRDVRFSRDLRVEGLSLAATAPVPGRIRRATVSFRIVNHGKDAVTAPFQTSISPGQVDTARRTLSPFTLTSDQLAPGKTIYVSRTVNLPDDIHEFDVRVETDMASGAQQSGTRRIGTLHFENPVSDVGRWVTIGPQGVKEGIGAIGVLFSIALDPVDPSIIYVSSHQSGAWKTTDGGASWGPITDSLPSLKIMGLAVDPNRRSRVFVATLDAGIYTSADSGTSWTRLADSTPLNLVNCCSTFIFDPANTNSLYLSSNDGVYHSLDGGTTWKLSLNHGPVASLLLDNSTYTLYASVQDNFTLANTGIYSLDPHDTLWNKVSSCASGTSLPNITSPTAITLSRSGSTIYAAFKSSSPPSYQLFRTTGSACGSGAQFALPWEARWNPPETGTTPVEALLWNSIYSDPVDPNYVFATGTGFWLSTDGGATFNSIGSIGHSDHHGYAAVLNSPANIFVVSDGGIYSSSSHGAENSWKYLGEGITNLEYYDLAQAATDPTIVIGGTQDNANQLYNSTSLDWTILPDGEGDGFAVAIDPTNAQKMYTTSQGADSIKMSTDGGSTFTSINSGLPTNHACDNQMYFKIHPKDPSTLIGPCNSNLWRASPPGSPWSIIFTSPRGSVVRAAIDPSVDLYYAGGSLGDIYAAPSGANWQSTFRHPASSGVTDIQVDVFNPAQVYVSFTGTGTQRVFLLKRASSAPSSMSSVDITSNLPSSVTVLTLAVDPEVPFTLYAGTDQGGVFRGHSWNNGANWSWISYNNGLPPGVKITRLSFHPVTGVLRAGSYGRSAFEVNTDSPLGGLVSVSGNITLIRVNDVGSGYGPATDFMDVEAVVWMDSQPGRAFGFQLRGDSGQSDHSGMLKLLREAFNTNRPVQLDVIRTGVRNGRILRVIDLQ